MSNPAGQAAAAAADEAGGAPGALTAEANKAKGSGTYAGLLPLHDQAGSEEGQGGGGASDGRSSTLMAALSSYVGSRELSDLDLVSMEGTRFPAHKLVLCCFSEPFRRMLSSGMQESTSREVQLPDTPGDVLRVALEYLYTGALPLNHDNALPLLKLGDQYDFKDMTRTCQAYLRRAMSDGEVGWPLYLKAQQLGLADVQAALWRHFMSGAAPAFSTSIGCLDHPTLMAVLQADETYLSEYELFRAAMAWVEADWAAREAYVNDIIARISFSDMTLPELGDCSLKYRAKLAHTQLPITLLAAFTDVAAGQHLGLGPGQQAAGAAASGAPTSGRSSGAFSLSPLAGHANSAGNGGNGGASSSSYSPSSFSLCSMAAAAASSLFSGVGGAVNVSVINGSGSGPAGLPSKGRPGSSTPPAGDGLIRESAGTLTPGAGPLLRFDYVKDVVRYIVPYSSACTITVAGARAADGQHRRGGRGAIVSATLRLARGDELLLLAGGMSSASPEMGDSGGGGASVVAIRKAANEIVPLLVAGGGGGTRGQAGDDGDDEDNDDDGGDAQLDARGSDGRARDGHLGAGGADGQGGRCADAGYGAGGGGWFTRGVDPYHTRESSPETSLEDRVGASLLECLTRGPAMCITTMDKGGGWGGGAGYANGVHWTAGGGGGGGYSGGGGGRGGGGGGSYVCPRAECVSKRVGNNGHGYIMLQHHSRKRKTPLAEGITGDGTAVGGGGENGVGGGVGGGGAGPSGLSHDGDAQPACKKSHTGSGS